MSVHILYLPCLREAARYNPRVPPGRYDFMWRVGGRDMYEGLNKLAHTITDSTIAAYGVMDVLHIILLVIAIIVPCAHVMLIFR